LTKYEIVAFVGIHFSRTLYNEDMMLQNKTRVFIMYKAT